MVEGSARTRMLSLGLLQKPLHFACLTNLNCPLPLSTTTGSFALPMGCASASLGVSFDKLARLTFNSPQVPVLAVITKDPIGSMVSYFGTGTTQVRRGVGRRADGQNGGGWCSRERELQQPAGLRAESSTLQQRATNQPSLQPNPTQPNPPPLNPPQGRVKHRLAHKVEFCYAPTISEISVAKTAVYSTGMQPGTASWSFAKSVELAQPYTNNRAQMFNGDTVDATWTLAATKMGSDVNFQGMITGTITINNPTPALITVNSIIDQITNGPAATVTCPVGTPFTVPACSFATCSYTAYYPTAPPPGTYTSAAQVQFQVMGSAGYPSAAQGATIFNVGMVGGPALATTMGQIPVGAAMVTDPQSPSGNFMFGGPGQQSFTTQVTCGGASASGALSNTATLTGANGQQIAQSATVQKQCYDLQVTVATNAAPFVGRWGWAVSKTASPATMTLKPDAKSIAGASAGLFGKDYAATTTGDVVYTVTYTRNPPAGFIAGTPAFEATGEVIVQNPAPVAARLQSVLVSISNSRGGQPYTTEASCPVLNIGGGQRVTCQWRATPNFNPVGQSVRGVARYINLRNGEPRGSTTDFTSSAATIVGAAPDGPADGPVPASVNATRRGLLQTWGGKTTVVGSIPELEAGPAVATTIYGADGSAMVVPNMAANGSGVIVSGGAAVTPGSTPLLAVSQGIPVVLPSALMDKNGQYINEAGPAGAAATAALSGLQDECVDVADTFLTSESNAVEGRLISGSQPSGRICSTTTFSYTMRYGPYGDCVGRKSVNAATFQTVDTQTRGSGQSDVNINVEGCANPGALKIAPGKLTTISNGGYSWSVTKRVDQQQLAIGQDSTATATYTVEYKRSGAKAGTALSADVSVSNPSDYPIPVESVTYTATTMCDNQGRTTSGPVTCDADVVPAKGKINCKVAASVPCASHGAYTVVVAAANGFTLTSIPAPFTFNDNQKAATSNGECADVKDVFLAGEGNVGGALVSGTRPNGRLCGSKTFTYTVRFGPYPECTSFKVGGSLAGGGAAADRCVLTSSRPPPLVPAPSPDRPTHTPNQPTRPPPGHQHRHRLQQRHHQVDDRDEHAADLHRRLRRLHPRRGQGLRQARQVVAALRPAGRQQVRQRVEAAAGRRGQGDAVLPQAQRALRAHLWQHAVAAVCQRRRLVAHGGARRLCRRRAAVCHRAAQLPERRAPALRRAPGDVRRPLLLPGHQQRGVGDERGPGGGHPAADRPAGQVQQRDAARPLQGAQGLLMRRARA